MNDAQKAAVRCTTVDDRVSLSTLSHRIGSSFTLVYMRGLVNRGLFEEVKKGTMVYRLTRKGRQAAREARRELDRPYESARLPTPMTEGQRGKAKAKRELHMPPLSSIVGTDPATLAAYLRGEEPDGQPAGGTSPSSRNPEGRPTA